MSGLLQRFEISTDSVKAIEWAVEFPFLWNKKGVTHYVTGANKGSDFIQLKSYGNSSGDIKLPYPLTTPEMVNNFLRDWLFSASYGEMYDTDGSCTKGWLITQGGFFSEFLRLQTEWIVYGK